MNWQLQRLVDEWVRHGRIIIGVDFDDTIRPFKLTAPFHIARMDRTRALLRHCVEVGARIVIHTACGPEEYPHIHHFCEAVEIPIEAINENLPGLQYGNAGKPYANIYLDDRAGLEAALDILSAAVEIIRISKNETEY